MADQKKYTNKLEKSRVLVIGGTSGIGFAVAEACLEHDALVTISSSNPDRISAAISRLQTSYPSRAANIFGQKVDLSNKDTLETELKSLLDASTKLMGGVKLDHIIYTAGDALATIPIADMTIQNVIQAGTMRFFAPLLLAKFVPQYLAPTFRSSYTITSGSIGENPVPNWSVVASYAGALHSMVRNLALDLKPLRVNGVAPGGVDTELWKVTGETRERLLKSFGDKCTTGRIGQVEDVAESFLAVLKDGNMTGVMVRTDGGGPLM